MAHRLWDFTIEFVAGEIKCLEIFQIANLSRNWAVYDVVLQKNGLQVGQVPNAWGEQAREILAWSLQASDKIVRRASDHGEATGVDRVLVPVLEHAMGVLEEVLDPNQRLHFGVDALGGEKGAGRG